MDEKRRMRGWGALGAALLLAGCASAEVASGWDDGGTDAWSGDAFVPGEADAGPAPSAGVARAGGAPVDGPAPLDEAQAAAGPDLLKNGRNGGNGGAGNGGGANGGGGGDRPDSRGFAAPTTDPCEVLEPTKVGTPGPDVLRGSDNPRFTDVIFGLGGDDVIWGNDGDDIICGGPGDDEIHGGKGADYIDGGFGKDAIDGGEGNDILHGRDGGDEIHGGPGDDEIFGDLLDDKLWGDEGNDLIIGGHGTDEMHGGPGNDWLRGDMVKDTFDGGPGGDTASFATATPPGQPLADHGPVRAPGITVDTRHNLASGDGFQEPVTSIERVIGSPFDDWLAASGNIELRGGYGNDAFYTENGAQAVGGPGQDYCNNAPCDPANEPPGRDGNVFVFIANQPRDVGLVVLGTGGDDYLTIAVHGGVASVRSSAGPVTPGFGCDLALSDGPGVNCTLPAELRYILAWGGDGKDHLELLGNGFPRDLTAIMDGGNDDDVLIGSDGQDILFAGPTGHDRLEGNAGEDALVSDSQDGDIMLAGPGNDQLVANYPCAAHVYDGGDGTDIAGFAQVGADFDAAEKKRQAIHAQLGHRAYQPHFCSESHGTKISHCEILEGAGGNDTLIGDDGDNVIWGRQGDDTIYGLGGDDQLYGLDGDDDLYGGPGRDQLFGGPGGNDRLFAGGDGQDAVLDCDGGTLASKDPQDPPPRNCR